MIDYALSDVLLSLARFDQIRGLEQTAHRCRHGINLERAVCCTCMDKAYVAYLKSPLDPRD